MATDFSLGAAGRVTNLGKEEEDQVCGVKVISPVWDMLLRRAELEISGRYRSPELKRRSGLKLQIWK